MSPDTYRILAEYDQNTKLIRQCRAIVRQLAGRQRSLFTTLDAATRPESPLTTQVTSTAIPVSPLPTATVPAQAIRSGYTYRGEAVSTFYAVDTYVSLLKRLWIDFPDRRPQVRAALNSSATTRFGIAESTAALFPAQSALWRYGKARRIDENAFVDINLSNVTKRIRLRKAVAAVCLEWKRDVVVHGMG